MGRPVQEQRSLCQVSFPSPAPQPEQWPPVRTRHQHSLPYLLAPSPPLTPTADAHPQILPGHAHLSSSTMSTSTGVSAQTLPTPRLPICAFCGTSVPATVGHVLSHKKTTTQLVNVHLAQAGNRTLPQRVTEREPLHTTGPKEKEPRTQKHSTRSTHTEDTP